MVYVYVLESEGRGGKTYVGITKDLKKRLAEHNRGSCEYTKKYTPWRIKTYIAFSNIDKARKFERYLKKSSGWRFAKKWFM